MSEPQIPAVVAATTELSAELAEHMRTEIQFDIERGILPNDVGSFSELHDYVDANEYVLEGLEAMGRELDTSEDLTVENAATSIIDAWLKMRLSLMQSLSVKCASCQHFKHEHLNLSGHCMVGSSRSYGGARCDCEEYRVPDFAGANG